MMSLLIIFLLIFGILMGMKRGLILQVFHLIGFIVAFIVAVLNYKKLAERITMWIPFPGLKGDHIWADILNSSLAQDAFYNMISFMIIFFATKIALQILASMLDFVASLPILHAVNKVSGGILGFIEVYLLVFIVLFILSLTPIDPVQDMINQSSLAQTMIKSTPFLSEKLKDLWFVSLHYIINL
ncbi:putative membrane protein required for colicin V production [Cerasibacillus quisquiliarum]|uniref:Putative transmembrane protein YshB n=1 Tax=Cerasibacillus quisquiliarum TaxID=227865 RepID=A0A511V144_9BACI|nr:CvpA family protein [Cerasibacillus quisquiliarum]MBB5145679.1 putative membrane protein required for colicin V production [Cerasibacillus quisquiliarum]GEN31473.1 putative transmembrane protein YshB [Cerasibacillus quisquiliarum]